MHDSPIKLATCNRCHAYVFLATSCGFKAAADPEPASRETYLKALLDGRRVFDVTTIAGRPHRLLVRTPASRDVTWDPQGRQTGTQRLAVAEHGCGASALSTERVDTTEIPPPPTACEAWQRQGRTPPPDCARLAFGGESKATGCPTCAPPPFDHGPGFDRGLILGINHWNMKKETKTA